MAEMVHGARNDTKSQNCIYLMYLGPNMLQILKLFNFGIFTVLVFLKIWTPILFETGSVCLFLSFSPPNPYCIRGPWVPRDSPVPTSHLSVGALEWQPCTTGLHPAVKWDLGIQTRVFRLVGWVLPPVEPFLPGPFRAFLILYFPIRNV